VAFVVDASVAVKWLVLEEDSSAALGLVDGGDELHAPRLLVAEVANAIWRKVRLGQVDPSAAGQLLATMRNMPVRWRADETICADAVRLAIAHDRPAYDFMYLAFFQSITLFGAGDPMTGPRTTSCTSHWRNVWALTR